MLNKNLRIVFALFTATMLVLVACKKKKATSTPRHTTKRTTKTPAEKTGSIVGKVVTYKSGKTTLKGYIAYDSSKKGKRPGVIVVHEWWGHNAYARRRANMLAKLGYVALALDMYGEGKKTSHPKDASKFMMAVMKNMKEGENRFKAAKELLEKHPMTNPAKVAAIGYCFGGAIVLHMARTGFALKGVASFHGNLTSMRKVKKGDIKAEILVMNGGADPFVKPEAITAFKKEMTDAGAKFKFISYPGAKHAFTNPDATAKGKKFKLPLAYNKEADQKSWAEMKTFFTRIFGS